MKSLLFALGLALCCFAQAKWKEVTIVSKELQDIWLAIAIACDSADVLVQTKGMPAYIVELSMPEEDVLSMLILLPMPDGCKNVTYQFRKGEDGKFHGHNDDAAMTVELLISRGKYLISILNVGNGQFNTTTLYGRSIPPTQDAEIYGEFKKECKDLGYLPEDMTILKPTVKCQK